MEFLKVLLLACLPAFGNFAGGVAAELVKVSPKALNLALHTAAGVVLAVVGVELMPQALTADRPWIVILCFLAGGVFFLSVDHSLNFVQRRIRGKEVSQGSAWSIFFGVSDGPAE